MILLTTNMNRYDNLNSTQSQSSFVRARRHIFYHCVNTCSNSNSMRNPIMLEWNTCLSVPCFHWTACREEILIGYHKLWKVTMILRTANNSQTFHLVTSNQMIFMRAVQTWSNHVMKKISKSLKISISQSHIWIIFHKWLK